MKTWNFSTGWKKARRRAECVALCLVIAPPLAADEPPTAQAPSMSLLEFLGEWETAEGRWVDPLEFEDPDPEAGNDKKQAEEDRHD